MLASRSSHHLPPSPIKTKQITVVSRKISKPHCVTDGKEFRLDGRASLDLHYPQVGDAKKKDLSFAQTLLLSGK
jgi:hypothetical protein